MSLLKLALVSMVDGVGVLGKGFEIACSIGACGIRMEDPESRERENRLPAE